jgi:aminoglycoside phosphotransferase (APT) family kinase protein
MTPDEARLLALAAVRRIGVLEAPLHVEERNARTVVVFPHYVAWVAHDEVGEGKLALERRVLRLLGSRLPVPLPTPLLDEGPVCLRTKLEGRAGPDHHRRVMADPSLVGPWADELSALAVAVHAAFSSSEQAMLVAGGLPTVPFLDLDDVLRAAEALPSRGLAFALVKAHRAQVVTHSDRTFLHGDLGSHNFLVDERGRVVGLFDVEEACVGDRHHDLRWLPSYGNGFLSRFLARYRQGSGALVDERRVRRLHALAALEQYGWGLRAPSQHHRTGRSLVETRAWALQAVDEAI